MTSLEDFYRCKLKFEETKNFLIEHFAHKIF